MQIAGKYMRRLRKLLADADRAAKAGSGDKASKLLRQACVVAASTNQRLDAMLRDRRTPSDGGSSAAG